MSLPNFLIIGAARSGTTALHRYLRQHPQVYMSPIKEPGFFAYENEDCDFYGADGSTWPVITALQEYTSLYDGVTSEVALGEASTDYLYNPTGKAPERIQYYIPAVKLIAVLRNPVEASYSHFLAGVSSGLEPLADFAQAVEDEERRIASNWSPFYHYTRKGFYGRQLKQYVDRFDSEQIRVYLYEDWKADNQGILRDIFCFLSVDDSFVPDTSLSHNVSGVPKSKILHSTMTRRNPVRSLARALIGKRFRQKLRMRLLDINLATPALEPALRQHLLQMYRPDILLLEELIARDLSDWLES